MPKIKRLNKNIGKIIVAIAVNVMCMPLIVVAQSPITSMAYSSQGEPTDTKIDIKGAGYSYSTYATSSSFTVNYASTASSDIESVVSFNIAGTNNFIPISFGNIVIKVQRAANSAVNSTRNFVAYWNKCATCPAAGATSGTFNMVAPKLTAMEESLGSNNINSGYDNIFNNTLASPHYANIERIDYIYEDGFIAIADPTKAGFAVFDRGTGDSFKIAAITSVDLMGNPTAYKKLVTVPASKFSSTGLLPASFDYVIFVSDPNIAGGEFRPSTRNNQNIRGVFISLQDLGMATFETVYGYSLFGQDVNPALGHVLTNHNTFPTNSSFAGCLDPLNVVSLFQSGIVVLPVKLKTFSGYYNKANGQVELQWRTLNEQNLKFFEIEKSLDGVSWSKLTSINCAENSNGSSYFYADRVVKYEPNLFYRLKMINADNSFLYSDIVRINITAKAEIDLTVNPTTLAVKTNTKIKQAYMVDITGKKLQSLQDIPSALNFEFPLSNIASGMYIVVLIDINDNTFSKKFVKF